MWRLVLSPLIILSTNLPAAQNRWGIFCRKWRKCWSCRPVPTLTEQAVSCLLLSNRRVYLCAADVRAPQSRLLTNLPTSAPKKSDPRAWNCGGGRHTSPTWIACYQECCFVSNMEMDLIKREIWENWSCLRTSVLEGNISWWTGTSGLVWIVWTKLNDLQNRWC